MKSFQKILLKTYHVIFFTALACLFLRGKILKGSLGPLEISCTSVKNILFLLFFVGICVLIVSKIKLSFPYKSPLFWGASFALSLSLLFSSNKTESFMTLGVVACYVGFYLLMRYSLKSKKELFRVLFLWSIAACFIAIVNIGYFYFIAIRSEVVPIVEDFPFWPGKNMLGLFLVLNASLALGVLLRAKEALKTSAKVWVFFVLAANLTCLIVTFSRGAWVAMIGVVGVLLFVRPKLFFPLVGLGLALFFLFAPAGVKGRLYSIFDFKEANVAERFLIWKSAFKMIEDDPWTGVGLGTFYQQYLSKYKMENVQLKWAGEHAHNLFLHVFAEIGILGLLVLIFFFASFLVKGVRNYTQQTDPFLKGAILGANLACVAFILYSLVDSTFNGNFSHHSMFHVNLCFIIVLSLMVFSWPKSQSS